jgi:hypothetical protein
VNGLFIPEEGHLFCSGRRSNYDDEGDCCSTDKAACDLAGDSSFSPQMHDEAERQFEFHTCHMTLSLHLDTGFSVSHALVFDIVSRVCWKSCLFVELPCHRFQPVGAPSSLFFQSSSGAGQMLPLTCGGTSIGFDCLLVRQQPTMHLNANLFTLLRLMVCDGRYTDTTEYLYSDG